VSNTFFEFLLDLVFKVINIPVREMLKLLKSKYAVPCLFLMGKVAVISFVSGMDLESL
jgi:hypothetical protein